MRFACAKSCFAFVEGLLSEGRNSLKECYKGKVNARTNGCERHFRFGNAFAKSSQLTFLMKFVIKILSFVWKNLF